MDDKYLNSFDKTRDHLGDLKVGQLCQILTVGDDVSYLPMWRKEHDASIAFFAIKPESLCMILALGTCGIHEIVVIETNVRGWVYKDYLKVY